MIPWIKKKIIIEFFLPNPLISIIIEAKTPEIISIVVVNISLAMSYVSSAATEDDPPSISFILSSNDGSKIKIPKYTKLRQNM